MPVRGREKVIAAFRRAPEIFREEMAEGIAEAANLVLADMKGFAPRRSGALIDALVVLFMSEGRGFAARVGLATPELARDYFYARFIEQGTKGYAVGERRETGAGRKKAFTRRIPPRPARPFISLALDANRDEIEAIMRRRVANAVRRVRRGG